MKAPDFIFRLDRHRRFLQGQASPSPKILRGQIAPRVIALIEPLFGPGFHISSDFQRQSLARRSNGESVMDPTQRKTVRFSLSRWREDKSSRGIGRSNSLQRHFLELF